VETNGGFKNGGLDMGRMREKSGVVKQGVRLGAVVGQ